MTSSKDLTAMLRRHYLPEGRPPGGVFAPEIGSPCGKRRADLIWLRTTTTGRSEPMIGHEIKVSRADVQVELADPTKSDPWAKFCNRWWLVLSDPALVEGLEVPPAWGILAPPSGRRTRSMTVVRPAPALHPIDPAPGIARLAAWMMHRHHDAEFELRADRNWQEGQVRRLQDEVRELRLTGGTGRGGDRGKRVARIIAQVEAKLRDDHCWESLADADVVAALVDLTETRQVAKSLRRELDGIVRDVERHLTPMAHVREGLRECEKREAKMRLGGVA